MTWVFVGFGLVITGTVLFVLELIGGKSAIFLEMVGWVYVIVGGMLTIMHERPNAGEQADERRAAEPAAKNRSLSSRDRRGSVPVVLPSSLKHPG